MFAVTILAASLLTLLFFLIKSKVNDPGIPHYIENWPILGHIHLFLGDNVNVVKQGFGTTDDGNTARRFFEYPEKTANITGLDEELIRRLAVILQAITSGEHIIVEKFKEYASQTAEKFVALYELYDSLKKISMHAIENGGCATLNLGITNYYMFTDPDDISTILNSATEKHYTYSFTKYWLGNGLITAPPHVWQANKKLLYPMFQQQILNKYLTIFNKQGRRLVQQFSDHNGKGAFNPERNALLISLETICQTALGSDVGEEMTRNAEFVAAMGGLMDCLITRFKKVWLHFNPIFEVSSVKVEQDKHLLTVNNLAKKLISKRKLQFDHVSEVVKGDSGEFNSFVDKIFKVAQNNKNFNEKQILDEINSLIFAGSDSSASTLIFCLMMLGHHQDVQDKVYKELQEVFANEDRDVDKLDLSKLVFLEAVIKETLRLYTITPIIARKINTDLKLKKYTLPAGADCFVSLYGLHRNAEWGKDANEFNPDRWMNPETLPKNSNLYAPFGGGKRYCIGKTYAMMSLKTTLAHVLRHYRIKADMNKLVTKMMVLLKPASGHHIILESRTELANGRE